MTAPRWEPDRYLVDRLPPDAAGRLMWGIRDLHDGGAWVETGGELERYPLRSSAQQWIRARRYVDEGRPRGSGECRGQGGRRDGRE
ncbi:hypothetical protein AB0D08_03695 [Kitasatospora sp. NPDC048540]|uniref:hypothetical protein n=1 Tax=unclassified Kitasatospora TaxID=2633591 RepID=UPI00053A90B7|nr:hypothetical protein [Kitasatospora sp. MBT63]